VVLSQVAGAMADIHARDMRHGDLKTANVMMAEDLRTSAGRAAGYRWVAKVTDFGLSRMRGAGQATATIPNLP